MKIKSLYALLFCIFTTGCLDGQKQSDHAILIAYTSTEFPELGSSVCYLNERGDTVIPFGKYHYGGSDTIRHIGFVVEPHTPGWTTINNKGEKLFYTFSFDNGPDYVEEGLFRIINDEMLMGFADTLGNVVIQPQFAFVFPFKDGKAEVTYTFTLPSVVKSSFLSTEGTCVMDGSHTGTELFHGKVGSRNAFEVGNDSDCGESTTRG